MRALGLLLIVGLVAAAAAWRIREEEGPAVQDPAARAPAPADVDAPVLEAAPSARTPETIRPRWWLRDRIESVDPTLTRARVEAHWWRAKPAPPYAGPDAVFATEVDLLHGRADVRIDGNDEPGFVVLFVADGLGLRRAHPFLGAVNEVQPPLGYGPAEGPSTSILVGAKPLALRLRSADDLPVVGVDVEACETSDPAGTPLQRERTGADGRVRFGGFHGPEVAVSWRAFWQDPRGPEYASGGPLRLPLSAEEHVLRVPRNPWVRLRLRAQGLPEEAWAPVPSVHAKRIEAGPEHALDFYSVSHGFCLSPGRWRCAGVVPGLGAFSIDTPLLAFDSVTTLEVPAELPSTQGWLEIGFDRPSRLESARRACAIELRDVSEEGGWSGMQAHAPHERLVVCPPPGTYELTGAFRTAEGVRWSPPRVLTLLPGRRTSIELETEAAGGISIPAPAAFDGIDVELLERDHAHTGGVEDGPFRFAHVGVRRWRTTWWLPAGTWNLVERDWGGQERRRLGVNVEAGRVVELGRDADGRLTVSR